MLIHINYLKNVNILASVCVFILLLNTGDFQRSIAHWVGQKGDDDNGWPPLLSTKIFTEHQPGPKQGSNPGLFTC